MIPFLGVAVFMAISAGAFNFLPRKSPHKFTPENPPESHPISESIKSLIAPPIPQNSSTGIISNIEHIREPGENESWLNQRLVLSGIALGTTTLGLFIPILNLLTTPLVIYLEWPLYQATKSDLLEKRTVKVEGLMAIFTTSTWLTGAYIPTTFSIFTIELATAITERTKSNSQQKLINMFDQQPRTVWRLINGQEIETNFNLIQAGDLIVVRAGETLPVDGIIHEGMALIDQQRLTGEARPIEKSFGDSVFAATLVLRGRLVIRVLQAGETTLAAQIAQVLNQTTAHHLAVEERGLEWADKSVMPSLLAALFTVPLRGFSSSMAVLSAMPGIDMYFAGPLALLNCLHLTTRNGILIKDGRSLELLHNIDTVVFDKTGTLTLEQPTLVQIHTFGEIDPDELLIYAATAEQHQHHPIAEAIRLAALERNLLITTDAEDARYEVGYGVQVRRAGRLIHVGSARFMHQEGIILPAEIDPLSKRCAELGHNLIYIGVENNLAGVLELHPTIRPEARSVIQSLQQQGLNIYILSGDQTEPTRHLAAQLGIQNYCANVLPNNKADFITELQSQGRQVCFIGDGINDAIALKKSQVAISLRGAATLATDSAQIILMDQSLQQLPALFDLAHKLEQNLLTSFKMSIGTGVVIMTGALAFQMSVGMAVVFGAVASLGIVGNAMLPLWYTLNQEQSNHNEKDFSLRSK